MIFIIIWSLHLTYHYLTLFSLKNFPLSLGVSQYDHIFIIVISVVRRIGGEGKHPWCPGEQGCLQRRSSPLQHNHRYHHVTLASPSPTCSCLLLMDSSQPLSRLYYIKVGLWYCLIFKAYFDYLIFEAYLDHLKIRFYSF